MTRHQLKNVTLVESKIGQVEEATPTALLWKLRPAGPSEVSKVGYDARFCQRGAMEWLPRHHPPGDRAVKPVDDGVRYPHLVADAHVRNHGGADLLNQDSAYRRELVGVAIITVLLPKACFNASCGGMA